MQLLRKISLSGSLLLALLLITTMWVGAAAAAPAKVNHLTTVHRVSVSRSSNSNAELLQRLVWAGRLAPTVHVLAGQKRPDRWAPKSVEGRLVGNYLQGVMQKGRPR